MLPFLSRGASVLSHSLTALSMLIALFSASSMLYPPPPLSITDLRIHGPVVFSNRHSVDVALFSFDLSVDASALFGSYWNAKQVQIQVVAHSVDGSYFTVHDAIVSPNYPDESSVHRPTLIVHGTQLDLKGQRSKFMFPGEDLRNAVVRFEVRYEVMPFVGQILRVRDAKRSTIQMPSEYVRLAGN
eukprot:ANDGO_02785.mRNA.1 hypothetical protein H310_11958